MRPRRDAALGLLRLILVASIGIPIAIFCYGGWVMYRSTFAHADEQLTARLDAVSEQALKVFQSVDLTFAAVEALTAGMYASEILRDLNYQIIEAKDSASALRLVEAGKNFDLLLTDVVLPGKNGRELEEEVLRRNPGVKVIFMTGYSRNAIVHQGRLDRGAELISKPLIEAIVARKLRQVLDAS